MDLSPRWDYDLEKAKLLNCPVTLTDSASPSAAPTPAAEEEGGADTGLIVGLSLGIGIPLLLGVGGLAYFMGRKAGYAQLAGAKGASNGNTIGNGSI